MKKHTKEDFIELVRQEIHSLKLNTTQEEKDRLIFKYFEPNNIRYCVYGLIAQGCETERACSLIEKCCKKMMDYGKTDKLWIRYNVEEVGGFINGAPKKNMLEPDYRNWEYYSTLETYILLKGTKKFHRGIFNYIKGKSQTLILE